MDSVTFIIFLLLFIGIYFAPTSLALSRNTVNKTLIFFVNLFLGWTLIGWCFALLLASISQTVDARNIEQATLRRLRGR